jgi:hypothetical protein
MGIRLAPIENHATYLQNKIITTHALYSLDRTSLIEHHWMHRDVNGRGRGLINQLFKLLAIGDNLIILFGVSKKTSAAGSLYLRPSVKFELHYDVVIDQRTTPRRLSTHCHRPRSVQCKYSDTFDTVLRHSTLHANSHCDVPSSGC